MRRIIKRREMTKEEKEHYRQKFLNSTIQNDFMFCHVMQDEGICTRVLKILLKDFFEISSIKVSTSQKTIENHPELKFVRLDVLATDEEGNSYDIEMQVGNEYNIPKRMRYYQAVLDVAFLDKGYSYKALNNSIIIFVCLFDPIGNDRAVYTFENICVEDKTIPLQDGTKKIILNANAFNTAGSKDLQGFLQYVKTGKVTTEYTGRIEQMIQTVKQNEQARQEYRLMSTFEMDARYKGIYENKRETAKLMKNRGYPLPIN